MKYYKVLDKKTKYLQELHYIRSIVPHLNNIEAYINNLTLEEINERDGKINIIENSLLVK